MDERHPPNEAPTDGLSPLLPLVPDELPLSPTFEYVPSTPRPSQSHRHDTRQSQSPAQPVERLAHRLSKQSLKQSVRASSPILPQEHENSTSSSARNQWRLFDGKVLDYLNSQSSIPIDVNFGQSDDTPTMPVFQAGTQLPPPARSLKRSIAEISRDDPVRKPQQPWPRSYVPPVLPVGPGLLEAEPSANDIPFDTAADVEVDDGFVETDDYAWAAEVCRAAAEKRATTKRHLLPFRTSSEAARQCQMLVRNVPRMRRRKKQCRREEKGHSRANSSANMHQYHDASGTTNV